MAKKAKCECFLDRISSLPDPIISQILSFLPRKDAVRTSILSSKWRFFFHPNKVSLECFKVNDLWIKQRLWIDNFSIKDPSQDDDYLRIYGWISAALWRGVKNLDIVLYHEHVLELPTHLFTCRSLVSLKLDFKSAMNVPTNLHLPNLKTLQLRYLEFKVGCSIHRLISSCPVLEDLVIAECYFDDISELNIHSLSLKSLVLDYDDTVSMGTRKYDYVTVINAPSLVCFRYIDMVGKDYTLSNMDSLGEAEISIDQLGDMDLEPSATKLFRAILNVKFLSLSPEFDGFETLPRRLLDEQIVFHNLVDLNFRNPCDGWKGTWLVNFLHCAPNLKTLTLYMVIAELGIRALPKEVPSCLSFHLKEITFSKFEGDARMFELVSYFFNNAIVLDKFVLGIETLSEKDQLSILKKILRLPKNSKKCEVVTC